jgi:pyruvate/2-oxoglutarate dehydrogenase complex dihydrolipoamide acyltransferase (E2) component
MDDIGTYEERRFPESRKPTIDTLDWGKRKHHVTFLVEVDLTDAREFLHELKARTGEGLSFTGWVVKCIGQAVSEHKIVQSMRRGRGRLILFDDVDVSVVVKRSVENRDNPSETLPMPYVIRRANEKTVKEIHDEIRSAQSESFGEGEVQLGAGRDARLTRTFNRMPRFLRNLLVWRRLANNPFFAKKMIGTVVVTSIGSIAKSSGNAWAIPIGIHPLVIALGSISRKPGVVGDEIKIREYLSMTIMFDHDVVDGVPAGRFAQRLKELLEQGHGLSEY